MTDAEIERVAGALTTDERAAVLFIGDDVKNGTDIDHDVGVALYDRGVISSILAAGHHFTNLTDLGLAVKHHLEGERS